MFGWFKRIGCNFLFSSADPTTFMSKKMVLSLQYTVRWPKKQHIYIQIQTWTKNEGKSTKQWCYVHGFGVLTSRFLKAWKHVCAMFYFIFKFPKKRGSHWKSWSIKVRSPHPVHIISNLWTFAIPNPWYFWCQVCDAGARMAPNNVSGSGYSSIQYC